MEKKIEKEVWINEIRGEIPNGVADDADRMEYLGATIRTIDEDNLEDKFLVSYDFAKDLNMGQKLKITIEKMN